MMGPCRSLVFGAGAIGTYVGGSLALAGNRVTFIEQAQAIGALRQGGLHLELVDARKDRRKVTLASCDCFPTLEEALEQGPYDFAILALKSFDTDAALEAMRPLTGRMPPLLCLQNGVDNEPALAAILGEDRVIPGTVTSSIGRRGVGDIVLERLRGVGLADGHGLSLFIWQALKLAGLNPRLYPRPLDMKWSKMLTNLPANATAAILNMTAAEVFGHPGLVRMEMRMLREALAVMKAGRIRVTDLPGTPTRLLALGTRLPAVISHPLLRKAIGGGRGGKMPSFHIDLHSGRGRSEVDWLNGAVARHGQQCGLQTPVNSQLTRILQALTNGAIRLEEFDHQPTKLLSMIPRG